MTHAVSAWRAGATVAGLLTLAVAVQVSFLARLGLPGSTPAIVLVVVAAAGLAYGRTPGAVAGFGGGLLLDLAPPADHAAGQWALVLTLAGYVAGLAHVRRGATLDVRPSTVLGIGVLSGTATIAALGVGAVADGWWPGMDASITFVGSSAAYGAILAVGVLPLVRPALRWASRSGTRRGSMVSGSMVGSTGTTRPW